MLDTILETYIDTHTTPETDVLYQLNRQTHLKVLRPNMLSHQAQGVLLKLFSQMIKPKTILEVGTYTGYSAICLCAGLQKNGKLHTIDINEELYDMQMEYFEMAGVKNNIKTYIGDAMQIIPTINETFDLVFLDGDKVNYPEYYDILIDKIAIGGIILADNTLWKGQVYNSKFDDKYTKALRVFNQKVLEDKRVENTILPLRDGMSIIRRCK